jgi:hypothetical protein
MGQKFFISFNSADRPKAHWIAWALKEAGHEVAVHDWEIPAGGSAPLWMNTKLAWADRLVAVISPDYIPARYSPIEWASQIWNDPDGTKGSVIPVIIRPTSNMPPLLNGLSRIDLTNCSEAEARRRLIKGVDTPAPPQRKPAFAKVTGEAPDSQHTAPAEKPTFVQVSVNDGVPRWLKLSVAIAVVALAVFAALIFFVGRGAMFNVEADRGGVARSPHISGSTEHAPGSKVEQRSQGNCSPNIGALSGGNASFTCEGGSGRMDQKN